jgi:hypothetical protein
VEKRVFFCRRKDNIITGVAYEKLGILFNGEKIAFSD